MACPEYELLISRYMDEALGDREQRRLLAHIQRCASCSATLARYRQMGVMLGRLPTFNPSPEVRGKVLAAGVQGQGWMGAPARSHWRRRAVVGLAATVLGVVVFVGLKGLDREGSQLGDSPFHQATPPGHPVLTKMEKEQGAGMYTLHQVTPGTSAHTLQEAIASLYPHVSIPAHLPPGACVERLSLEADEVGGTLQIVDLVYFVPPDTWLQLRQLSWPAAQTRLADLVQRGRVLIGTTEWWYGQRQDRELSGAVVHVLLARRDGLGVQLEAPIPLEELIKVAQSVR